MNALYKKATFTIVAMLVGFMAAVQYNTVKKPVVRDTRSIWELREALGKELELQSQLIHENHLNEERIHKYESKIKNRKEEALRQTLQQLKKEAGYTEYIGPGVKLTIEPLNEALLMGGKVEPVSPVNLQRLLNELNMYGAKQVSIDGERITQVSVIREINGETRIDNHVLNSSSLTIQVGTESLGAAEKIFNQMQVSPAVEDFFMDNLQVTISKPMDHMTIPGKTGPIRTKHMQPAKVKGE